MFTFQSKEQVSLDVVVVSGQRRREALEDVQLDKERERDAVRRGIKKE